MIPCQLALELGHRPALEREDFLVAPSNAGAVAWIDRWPDWPTVGLSIVGPAGSGKSHLACVFAARATAQVLEAAALDGESPRKLLGACTSCVIEDADRAPPGEALLHLYNVIMEREGTLVLTGRSAPARWTIPLADLASRLRAMPTTILRPPDEALIAAVMIKQFADRQLRVGEEVIAYLVTRIERSLDAAGRAVAALDRAALRAGRPVTIALAREILPEIAPPPEN